MNTKPLLPLSGLTYGALLILASEFFLVSAGMVIKHLNGVVSTEHYSGGSTKVNIRRMRSSEEPALRVVFYFALFASVLSVIPAALAWLPLTGETLLWLFLLGVLATLAQWALTAAYGHAPAGQLGAFTYASVIFAAVLGWWLWGESLSLLAIAGIGTIIAAGLLVMLGQARLPVARLVEDGS
jgi:drug/metabolite transporter (DMT)-like permease